MPTEVNKKALCLDPQATTLSSLALSLFTTPNRYLKREKALHQRPILQRKLMAGMRLFVALVAVSVAIGGKWVEAQVEQVVGGDRAQVQHVVGGDRGWDPSSDIGSWSSGRIFRVGDKIWFTYSASQDKVVEVKSKEEYDACDVSNPIRMYTNGLDCVTLDGEGFRYFASGKPDTCRNGLKLHVEVQPQAKHEHHDVAAASERSALVVADGPTAPSASTHLNGLSLALFLGLLLCYLGL